MINTEIMIIEMKEAMLLYSTFPELVNQHKSEIHIAIVPKIRCRYKTSTE